MFGPPSSPPPVLHKAQENELRSALLPAFGHDSAASTASSPSREAFKRKFTIYRDEEEPANQKTSTFLPTPLPTSEANMQGSSPPPSSPQQEHLHKLKTSIDLKRVSMASRSPLQQLVIVRVPTSGGKVTIGRSSKSANFTVKPSNRLTSRVHASIHLDTTKNLLMIECLGWNGLTVSVPQDAEFSSARKDYKVARGQILNIEKIDGVTMDIHGEKALVEFFNDLHTADLTEDESWSQSDPIEIRCPTPKRVRIDEDYNKENQLSPCKEHGERKEEENHHDADVNDDEEELNLPEVKQELQQKAEQQAKLEGDGQSSRETETPEPTKLESKVETSNNEPTKLTASDEPTQPQVPLANNNTVASLESANNSRASSVEPHSDYKKVRRNLEDLMPETKQELLNIIANHIAFSRQSAVPFAAVRKANSVLQSLPKPQVRQLIRSIPCIGTIEGGREDTTGRKAEDEYYYDQDRDENIERKQVVQSTKGHRSLRNCRKTPKQYFYRPLNLD